jgi:hypothetical protein
MATKKDKQGDSSTELLRDLLIAQLGLAGVGQADIRKIAGCDMNRVNRIVKPIKKAFKAQGK